MSLELCFFPFFFLKKLVAYLQDHFCLKWDLCEHKQWASRLCHTTQSFQERKIFRVRSDRRRRPFWINTHGHWGSSSFHLVWCFLLFCPAAWWWLECFFFATLGIERRRELSVKECNYTKTPGRRELLRETLFLGWPKGIFPHQHLERALTCHYSGDVEEKKKERRKKKVLSSWLHHKVLPRFIN